MDNFGFPKETFCCGCSVSRSVGSCRVDIDNDSLDWLSLVDKERLSLDFDESSENAFDGGYDNAAMSIIRPGTKEQVIFSTV